MEERKVADYFVVAGLPEEPELADEFSKDGANLKSTHNQAPITDITVVFPSLGDKVPEGYTMIHSTPAGLLANLNCGSIRSPEVFLCYRRGRDKPPLVDIGVMFEGRERILEDSEIVSVTPSGKPANVNNSAARTLVTFRRAPPTMPCNALVVTDIVVIVTSKGETAPHAFCTIKKNLNKGLVGSDVFLCYKKSMNRANLITYKPGILLRYPFEDRPNLPLPNSVPMFCLPMGCTLERWPTTAQQPIPIFSTFVLTVSDAAEKLYGSAITFYERYPAEKLTEEQRRALGPEYGDGAVASSKWTYNINKCICLLSRWPFFDTFERFLQFLHRMSEDGKEYSVPIERFISYLIEDVPFPSPQRPSILLHLSSTDEITLTQPEDLPLPRSGAGFRQLLMNLGSENCLLLLVCALTEQKILVHSLRPDVLTAVAEAVSTIMFPFKWQCPYIPLCPLGLAEVLNAPLPFLIGVDSRFFDLFDPPTDVNCVDLDTNSITVCDEKRHLSVKLLPKKAVRALRSSLEGIYRNIQVMQKREEFMDMNNTSSGDIIREKEFQRKRKEQKLELEIQEAFLKCMASVLKGYRAFLLPITKAPTVGTTDTNSLFDLQGFLRSRDKAHYKFYSLLTRTQMFIRFIEERSFVSDMDASLAFFDECTERVENEDEHVHLIELDESHHSERTMFIMPPEPIGLPCGQVYKYQGLNLNPKLFSYSESKNCLNIGKVKSLVSRLSGSGLAPGSPMARRTKHEIKVAQRLARKYSMTPHLWAKCLLGTCYSIWFIHLPSYVLMTPNKVPSMLRYAYEILVRVHKSYLIPTDEVCYRVMMQLCGVYSLPVVAVKLLYHMKRAGIQPNAITYGFYNRAVLEATWPSGMNNSSQLLWNKLRNVILGTALFRRAGRNAGKRRHSITTEDSISLAEPSCDGGSRTSVESTDSCPHKISGYNTEDISDEPVVNVLNRSSATSKQDFNSDQSECDIRSTTTTRFEVFDKFRSRGSIVRPSGLPLLTPSSTFKQQPFESSAGLLITGSGTVPLVDENLEIDRIDGLVVGSDRGCGSCGGGGAPPGRGSSGKQRNRSGSCSEFPQPLRPTPTSPKPTNDHCFEILTRSESFANDAGILAKLNTLKLEHHLTDTTIKSKPKQPSVGRIAQSCSKALFARRGSLNLSKLLEAGPSESCESSTENLGSSLGSFGGGSIDDLDNISSPSRNKLPSANNKRLPKEQNSRLSGSEIESLLPVNKTPVKSPSRTPVTENDPLGALALDDITTEPPKGQENKGTNMKSQPEIELDDSGAPVLFDRRRRRKGDDWASGGGVVRSATFQQRLEPGESEDDEETGLLSYDGETHSNHKKPIARSSTMPADVGEPNTNHREVGSFSTFKLPFTRLSPARFSLRKAADIRINTQIIESAFSNFSPSSLTSKKSNELLMGGLSSLKSAATSVAKKFDEIKEAISSNSTPIKGGSLRGTLERDGSYFEDESECGDDSLVYRRKVSSDFSPLIIYHHAESWGSNQLMEGSRKGSTTNLGEQWTSQQCIVYPKVNRDASIPVALQVTMTTCSKCHNCTSIIYDEEIMAGWVPEDSNLNTKCSFCDKATVPLLNVSVTDYRNSPMLVTSQENLRDSKTSVSIGASRTSIAEVALYANNVNGETSKSESYECDPITVPYLNPLVLRKELESILAAEGDSCLTQPRFVDEHPIIYWNMMWTFARIGVDSHLPGLALGSCCGLSSPHPTWAGADFNNVLVSTMWHNPRLHEEAGQLMYMSWNQNNPPSSLVSALITDQTTIPRSVLQKVVACLQCSDISEPLKVLAKERQKLKGRKHSLYREILFLGIAALGKDSINLAEFDREYIAAYNKIPEKDSKLYTRHDQPLSLPSVFCRQFFKPLEL